MSGQDMSGKRFGVFFTSAVLAMIYIGTISAVARGDDLAAAAGAARAQFREITPADIQQAREAVSQAAQRLDNHLTAYGEVGQGWKKFLAWEEFQKALGQLKPEIKPLEATYAKLGSGMEGLEQVWFANLRDRLRQYLLLSTADNAKVKAALEIYLERLAGQLEADAKSPSTITTTQIAESVAWLESARQAPDLVRTIRGKFGYPNLYVNIGCSLIDQAFGGPVDESAPVIDCILGTSIHGFGHTTGRTSARLVPCDSMAGFDLVVQATNCATSVGANGPVCIYNNSTTNLCATKRMWIDDDGIHSGPALASADAHSQINDIEAQNGRKFVERIAWRKAGKQKGEAEAIASQHAQFRFGSQIDAQAVGPIAQANDRYMEKVRQPLAARRGFPQQTSYSTTMDSLCIAARQGFDGQLAATTAPPALSQPVDASLQLHESAINNLASTVLSGMRLTDDMIRRAATDSLGKLPDRLKAENDPERFTIIFPAGAAPADQPVSVSFADGGYTVIVRGVKYITGATKEEEQERPGMDVMATYKFERTPAGMKAVRQGDLTIYAHGKSPDSPRTPKQIAILTVLQRKFGKIFEPEVKMEGIKLQGKLTGTTFVPVEVVSRNGWLIIGWQRAKATTPATVAVMTP